MTNDLLLEKIEDLDRRIRTLEFKLLNRPAPLKRCKLKEEQQKEAFHLYKNGGITLKNLGAKYGVSAVYMQQVLARVRYYV